MRRFSERHQLQTVNEINVTPLLDLAFVLLIIFMITTPLMENSVDLVVPTSDTARNPNDPQKVETVSISRDAQLEFNGVQVTPADLEAQLIALKEEKPELAVVVRSHKELPVQQLVDVIDILQRAKVPRIGVVTTPENPQ